MRFQNARGVPSDTALRCRNAIQFFAGHLLQFPLDESGQSFKEVGSRNILRSNDRLLAGFQSRENRVVTNKL
jgi:hypothetical protein